jgi:hypothetical protein
VASIPASGTQRPAAQQSPSAAAAVRPPGVTVPPGASTTVSMRIYNNYARCLLAHHAPAGMAIVGKGVSADPPDTPAAHAAAQACVALKPHPPWQEMPAYNANYRLEQAKWVNCMIAGGLKIVDVTPTSWAIADGDVPQAQSPAGSALMLRCEKRAFGD